jgi:hypothetical protein
MLLQHLLEDRREKMKLQTALGALVVVLLVAPGCGDQNGGTSQPGKTGGQSGSGSGGKGGSGGNGSGGNASGGSGGNASGGSGGNASGGSGGRASGGSGGNASGGSGGNGSGGSKIGGTTGSGGSASGGSGGTASGGSGGNASGGSGGNASGGSGGNASGGSGGNGTGGSTVPDAARDSVARAGGATGTGGAGTGGGTGTGGATSTGGSSGTGGSGGKKICTFTSGLNVAWVNFANDVPNPDTTTFNKIFKDTYDNGGRVVRWWFHTNGTVTPGYNSDGTVKTIAQSHIDGVKAILSAANSNKIAVNISLWSFDMAQDNASSAATNNKNLMTTDSLRQSYETYLTALVTGLKGTPGLYSYEIFNEPEGMSTTGWATQWKIDISYIQKAVNQWTAAIKAADPTIPVTNGSQTMDYRSKYTDSALVAAGGKSTGTLDFYEVHYYQVNGSGNNVFANPRSFWNMADKKLVIGEFAAYSTDTSPVAVSDSYTYLFNNGYDGAWAWSYTEGNSNYKWPSMRDPMNNLYKAQQATVNACP